MLGQVKKMDLGVEKLLSPVVHAALDTLLAKTPSLVDNCTFRDRIDENVAGAVRRIKLPSNPLESLCMASCAAVATVEWKIFTTVIQYSRAASR